MGKPTIDLNIIQEIERRTRPLETEIERLQKQLIELRNLVKNRSISDVVGQSEQLICEHCNKYKRTQGNGVIHKLCECGE